MEETKLTEGLVALARACGKSDEDRARASRALRAALAEVEGRGFERVPACAACGHCSLHPLIEDLAGELIMLGDRAEWLSERSRELTTPPPWRAPAG